MDRTKREREGGLTIDGNLCLVRYSGVDITFLDTPGHLNFVSKMVALLCQADAACLVVSVKMTEEDLVNACQRSGEIFAFMCYIYFFKVILRGIFDS